MRVLAITTSYPKRPGDGTAPFIERIVRAVAERGHEVDVLLPRHPDLVTEGRDHGLAIRLLPYWPGSLGAYAWGYATSLDADRGLRLSAWRPFRIAPGGGRRRRRCGARDRRRHRPRDVARAQPGHSLRAVGGGAGRVNRAAGRLQARRASAR